MRSSECLPRWIVPPLSQKCPLSTGHSIRRTSSAKCTPSLSELSRIRNENRRTRKPPTIKNSSPLAPLQLLPENLEVVLVGRLDEFHVGGGLFHPDGVIAAQSDPHLAVHG